MEKIVASCSDVILSVDREDITTAIKEGICKPDRIKYLGGWVDLKRFNPDKFSAEFIEKKKRKLGVDSNKKVIGIIARLVEEKGYLDLFEAVALIVKNDPDVVLVVVGPKEPNKKDNIDPKIVENYGIGKNVIFLGERTDVEEIFSIIDIFTLPSHREGIGISILESSAMGKPVVTTDTRGCREAVNDNKTGILVPVRNPRKLADAIEFFLSHPKSAEEFGRAGRKKIEKEFDERLVFGIINKEYKRLLKEKIK